MQSKEFYKEANDMAPGWGRTLYKIDRLREKYKAKKPITLNDACYIFWAQEGTCSSDYLAFKKWISKKMKYMINKSVPYDVWLGLFNGFKATTNVA